MIFDNPINEDYRVQSLGMKFNSVVQQNKLIIQVTCQSDNSQYTGKVTQIAHFSFDSILQHLYARNFRNLSKNQDLLKLEIMNQEVQLYSMSKFQLNELKQTTRALNQRQDEFRLIMNAQIDQLNKIKDQIKKLEITELKDNVKKSIERQQQFQMIVQSQNDSIQDIKDQINKFQLQVKKTTQQIKKINEDSLKSEITKITIQINQFRNQTNLNSQTVNNNCKISINQQQKKIIKILGEIDKIVREMQKFQRLFAFFCEDQLGLKNRTNQEIKQILKVQKMSFLQKPQMIEYKWSLQLKSDSIKINDNILKNTKQNNYYHFKINFLYF